MRFKDVLKMAFRDLGRRKGRTFLTSLAVAIGSMLIVTMVGLGTTAEKFVLDKLNGIGKTKIVTVQSQKYLTNEEREKMTSDLRTGEDYEEFHDKVFKKIDNEAVKKIKSLDGIETVQAVLKTNLTSLKINDKDSGKNYISICGYEGNTIFSKAAIEKARKDKKNDNLKEIVAGRSLNDSDKNAIVVNEKLLKEMGITDYNSVIGKEVVLGQKYVKESSMTIKPLEVKGTLVGVANEALNSKDSTMIFAPITLVSQIKSYYTLTDGYFNNKGYDEVNIFAKDPRNTSDISDAVKNMGYSYMSVEDIAKQIKNSFTIIEQILSTLGIIVLFVAALGTVNTMTMAIHERTKSIGIMKSVGASRGNIHNIFLTQSAAIGFIGGVMGLAFSFINIKIIEFALKKFLEGKGVTEAINFSMPTWLVLGSLAFAIVITLLSGIYPARKASRLDAIEALNS